MAIIVTVEPWHMFEGGGTSMNPAPTELHVSMLPMLIGKQSPAQIPKPRASASLQASLHADAILAGSVSVVHILGRLELESPVQVVANGGSWVVQRLHWQGHSNSLPVRFLSVAQPVKVQTVTAMTKHLPIAV
ncbi:MAG: hypothetical protein ACYC8T_34765 [Myxococcaceae bacterium]